MRHQIPHAPFLATACVLGFALGSGAQTDVLPPASMSATPAPPPIALPAEPVSSAANAATALPPIDLPPVSTAPSGEPMPKPAAASTKAPWNSCVLRAISSMPGGGGYSTGNSATGNFRAATKVKPDGSLAIDARGAQPSFCSSATYLVFLKALALIQRSGGLKLDAETAGKFLAGSQPDGVGIWGRWNANGPGTARLFFATRAGRNFTSLAEAQPGDFLKVWWTDAIGAHEKGHSVIFLGTDRNAGEAVVRFWSSNIPDGYGEKSVPLSRIRHMVFSRLENPSALAAVGKLAQKDAYLASMLKVDESFKPMLAKIGAGK